MKKIMEMMSAALFLAASLVSVFFLLSNLHSIGPAMYLLGTVGIIGFIFFMKIFLPNIVMTFSSLIKNLWHRRYFRLICMLILVLIGVIVRFYFLIKFSYTPTSDPMVFYEIAQKLSEGGGMEGNAYIAFFPWQAPYGGLLASVMALIGGHWVAVIVLNTIFDLCAALLVYYFVKKLTGVHSVLPMVGFGAWIFNPFNIVFTPISLPVIVVNFFIMATIYFAYKLSLSLRDQHVFHSIVFAVLFGISAGIGNLFRPVFVIAIIALLLLLLYALLVQKITRNKVLLTSIVFSIGALLLLGVQYTGLAMIERATSLTPASSASGWNIYVGSNGDSNGKWNRADEIRMAEICKDVSDDYNACHDKLRAAGVARYRSYEPIDIVGLLARKLQVFSSNQHNTYNTDISVNGYADSMLKKVLNVYTNFFLIALFLMSAVFYYVKSKNVRSGISEHPAYIFMALLLVGFFLSSALVEVSERYAQIMYPMFIIAATLSLGLSKRRPSLATKTPSQ